MPAKVIPAMAVLVSTARNGQAIMSAPCESRQSSHTRALAEARGEAPGREFHVSGGNWRNNPPELRPPAALPQNARMRGIQGNTAGRVAPTHIKPPCFARKNAACFAWRLPCG
jgi:hypothetical protein